MPEGLEPLPEIPTGDVPDAIRAMIQERHNARQAVIEAAETAAIVVLPAATQRDITERAGSIGATAQVLAGGGELRVLVALPPAGSPEPGSPEPAAQPAPDVPGDASAEPARPA